jgi:hypothetical protein
MNGAIKFLTLLSKEVRTNTPSSSPLPIMALPVLNNNNNSTTPETDEYVNNDNDSDLSTVVMLGEGYNNNATALGDILHETNKTYLPMKKEPMGVAVRESYDILKKNLSLVDSESANQHLQRVLDSLIYTLCKYSVTQGQYDDISELKSAQENGYTMFEKTCYSS